MQDSIQVGPSEKAHRSKALLPAANKRGIYALMSFQESVSFDPHQYENPQQAAGNGEWIQYLIDATRIPSPAPEQTLISVGASSAPSSIGA